MNDQSDENNDMGDTPDNTPDNNSAETWETEMTSAFDRRVRDLHEAPLTLENVKGKAVNIQRKRRAAVAGGILAAAAIVTPVAVVAADGLGGNAGGTTPIASQNPTPTATDPTTVPLTPADLVSYIEGEVYHQGDGTAAALPTASYTDVVVLGDYTVAYRRNDQAEGRIDVLDNGGITGTYDTLAPFVVNDAGDLAAFVQEDGTLVTISATGDTQELADGYDALYSTVTALGGTADSPIAYVTTSGNPNVVTKVFYDDRETVEGVIDVNDVTADGEVVAQTSYSDFGSCSAVLDATGKTVVETCDYLLEELSPNGDLILASDAYGDGIGRGYFVILDRDLEEVARFEPARGGGFVGQTAWIDDDTVAATAFDYQAGGWSIGTLDADGTQTDDVVGPEQGEAEDPAYFLAH